MAQRITKLLAFETTGRALSIALAVRDHACTDEAFCANRAEVLRACTDGTASEICVDETVTGIRVDEAFLGMRFFERRSRTEFNHLTELFPVLQALLDEADTRLEEIDALAVSAGPGSFTGIRIGISAVRALAQATEKPVIKVPTLESFVFHKDCATGTVACPVFDARRAQIYAGAFRLEESGALETLVPGDAYDPAAFFELLRAAADISRESVSVTSAESTHGAKKHGQSARSVCFFGDGIEVLRKTLLDYVGLYVPSARAAHAVPSTHEVAPCFPFDALRAQADSGGANPHVRAQSAVAVAKWALAYGNPVDYRSLEPVYLRQAEAQRKLEARLSQEETQREPEERIALDGRPAKAETSDT